MKAPESVSVLILERGQDRYVTLVRDLTSFGETASEADGALDLFAILGAEPVARDTGEPRILRLRSEGRELAFHTTAALRIDQVDTSAFFRLPRLLRDSGCAEWVRGLALLPRSTGEQAGTRELTIAVWVDLPELARAIATSRPAGQAPA